MRLSDQIHIGTSGWHYAHWRGAFYPEELPARELLSHYSRHYRTVEINNSFYRLPEGQTFRTWQRRVPDGFIFAVKVSRYITHMKKLHDVRQPLTLFLKRAEMLDNALGPLLLQLPPRWQVEHERLDHFLTLVPKRYRLAVECRDPSWFDQRVYNVLQRHGAALCLHDFKGQRTPEILTSSLVYIRLHGPTQAAYRGSYPEAELMHWGQRCCEWAMQGLDVYCYFNNDEAGFALQDAARLQEIVNAHAHSQQSAV